jgi:hypothetical protein
VTSLLQTTMTSPIAPYSVPIQEALSANISKQTALLPLLFAAISNAAGPSTGSSSSKPSVSPIFGDLARLDDELAVLMERARKHQLRWKRMEELKRQTIEVESQVRSALLVLEEGRRELEGIVADAKETVASIEMAQKSKSDICTPSESSGTELSAALTDPTNPETLLSFASSLSSYTSAPPYVLICTLPTLRF